MTREELIEVAVKAKRGGGSSEKWLVDVLIALDLLKADESKSADMQAREALAKRFIGIDTSLIMGLLDFAGLKVVEK